MQTCDLEEQMMIITEILNKLKMSNIHTLPFHVTTNCRLKNFYVALHNKRPLKLHLQL